MIHLIRICWIHFVKNSKHARLSDRKPADFIFHVAYRTRFIFWFWKSLKKIPPTFSVAKKLKIIATRPRPNASLFNFAMCEIPLCETQDWFSDQIMTKMPVDLVESGLSNVFLNQLTTSARDVTTSFIADVLLYLCITWMGKHQWWMTCQQKRKRNDDDMDFPDSHSGGKNLFPSSVHQGLPSITFILQIRKKSIEEYVWLDSVKRWIDGFVIISRTKRDKCLILIGPTESGKHSILSLRWSSLAWFLETDLSQQERSLATEWSNACHDHVMNEDEHLFKRPIVLQPRRTTHERHLSSQSSMDQDDPWSDDWTIPSETKKKHAISSSYVFTFKSKRPWWPKQKFIVSPSWLIKG